jgi:FKBP-type peptidyl-prolyl cis-trans isomerase
VRRLPALLTAAALATVLASSLTACAGMPGSGGCDPIYEPGSASELVTATGSFGTEPKVSFPTPLIADKPQVSTLIEGEGDPIPNRGTVDFDFSLSDGGTGQLYGATDYSDQPGGRLVAGQEGSAVTKSLQCARVGERFALTTLAADAYAPDALPQGLSKDTTLVFVVDVVASYLGKADGFNQLPQDGMPSVVTAPDGQPGITVPKTDPPAELRNSTIKAGGGATVEDGDTAVLHFSAWTWPTGGGDPQDVDSSWPRIPINQVVTKDAKGDASARIAPGAAAKVVGANVGSQLLVVIPARDAYPGGVPTGVDESSTLIYVIDVLGIQKKS